MNETEDQLRGLRQQLLEVTTLAGVLASGDVLDAEKVQALARLAEKQSHAALDRLEKLIDAIEDQNLARAS